MFGYYALRSISLLCMSESNHFLALDRLRATSNLLRCALHTAVPYMVTRTGMWPFKEANNSNLLPDVLVFIVHGSIMEIFYFMAGFLAARQLERHGLHDFVGNRLRRILLPFAIAMLILVPYVMLLFPVGAELEQHRQLSWHWPLWVRTAFGLWSSHLFPLGHLWFLYYLIWYYAVLVLLRPYFSALKRIKGIWWMLWGIAMMSIAFSKAWYVLNPLTTRIEWNSFIYFLSFFILGAGAFGQNIWIAQAVRCRFHFLGVFLAMSLVAPSFQQFAPQHAHPYAQWLHIGAIVTTALHSVSGVGAAVGWAWSIRKPLSAWMDWMSRASYWVYLVHLPIVMTLHLGLFLFDWPLLIKYLLALGISLWVSWLTYITFGQKLLR